jgi:branched-chain amino acid transport system substrate-binding protein
MCLVVIVILYLSVLAGCEKRTPIKIGFSGGLTGRLSDLGIAGRNGVMLAVEQINQVGGIGGRPIELIVKDDQQNATVAVQVDEELIEEGVVAIIGHMTSSMSVVIVPLMNKEKMLMLSPTTSTDQLTGIDDYFLRVIPSNKAETDHLVDHSYHSMKLQRIAGIYDLSNQAFSEGWYKNFSTEFERVGGVMVATATFTSGQLVSYLDVVKDLLDSEPDGLLIVAGALDTAMICQQMRKLDSAIPIISSGWAKSADLIRHGGSAVEGVIFSQRYSPGSQHEYYLKFQKQFRERFGSDPDFAAEHSYEAAQILFEALSTRETTAALKDAIINHTFQGLQEKITIDQYGDTWRSRSLIIVKDGQFVTVE